MNDSSFSEKWKSLSVRTKIMYILAILGFCCGWTLTFWGFLAPPTGKIDNTVLIVLGQSLGFCATAFGIGEFIPYAIKREMRKKSQEE